MPKQKPIRIERHRATMGIAYTVEGAAVAASVKEHTITLAINEGTLKVRRIGDDAVILRTDIQAWLESATEF